jgi:uncharacterized protein with beta-barrel porin domain
MADPKTPFPGRRRRLQSVGRHSLAVLLATTALGIVSAHAADAIWTGGNAGDPNEWVEPLNWVGGAVPDGTATFNNAGVTAIANDNGGLAIGTIQFTAVPNAQAYTIDFNNPAVITALGIVNNSTNLQTFNVSSGSSMVFQNASSASGGTGAVTINNLSGGFLVFQNTSTAGTATIVNSSILQFNDTSTAGSAHITNNLQMDFFDATSAGGSTIGNSGILTFNNTATASTATINSTGTLMFNDTITAASAHITNGPVGDLQFNGSSTAGASTIGNNGGAVTFNTAAMAGTSNITNAGGGLTFNNTSTADHATILNNGGGNTTFNNTSTADHANITNNFGSTSFFDQTNAGNATILNTGPSSTFFTLNSSAGSANITNSDSATFSAATHFVEAATAANSTITNNDGGTTTFGTLGGADTATAGNARIINNLGGFTEFLAATTAGSAVITNNLSGFLQFGSSGGIDTATAGNSTINNNGGTVSFNAQTTAGNAVVTTTAGSVFFFDTSTGGNAQFITSAGATFDMSGLTAAGMTAGSIAGAGSYILGAKNLAVGSNNLSTTVSGVISGVGGSLTKVGSGALTLSGINTYTGATNVNAGTLVVDGSTAQSSLTTVNAGGTLAGSGTVGNTAIAGGTLAPGSAAGSAFGPLTVQGSLSFTAASTYMIQVSPTNAGFTNVTGAANLGGASVNAVFQPGSFVDRKYTILTATGGLGGTTFNPAVVSNNPNLKATLSYDADDAFLNIKLSFNPPGGLNINQQNVANTLTNFFNTTGSIPAAFATLNAAGLTVASGELGTGVIQSSIKADDLFLNLLLDPTIAGRGAGFTAPGTASQFAADDEASAFSEKRLATPSERAAYAMATKAPLLSLQPANRWSVWGAGYGGSATTSGNAVVGSQDTTARVWGIVAGADYKVTPDSLIGFAVAGGGTSFSLANSLGNGSADLFQAGVFGRHNFGPAYLSAALAYGWHDVTTNRTVALAGLDQLQGRFRAETFSGRFEGGYRFATPVVGLTPYAAAQVISFNLPAYAEQAVIGSPMFALNYAAQTTTATRTELGLRTDKSFAMQDGVLTLRGRAAWAHDYNPDRAVTALFQSLPGTNFVVNGATGKPDGALVSAGAEMKWLSGFSLAATFEGEFSGNVTSYAGKGVAKYSW